MSLIGALATTRRSDMPYKSEKQRRYMHAKHPKIAARWDKKYGKKIDKGFYGHTKCQKLF